MKTGVSEVAPVFFDVLLDIFSIVDVCGVLTDSPNPRNYWKVLKHRLVKEGNETVINCNQLKLLAADGKKRLTSSLNSQGFLLNNFFFYRFEDFYD